MDYIYVSYFAKKSNNYKKFTKLIEFLTTHKDCIKNISHVVILQKSLTIMQTYVCWVQYERGGKNKKIIFYIEKNESLLKKMLWKCELWDFVAVEIQQ